MSCDDGIIDDGNKLIFPEEGEISFVNHVLPFLRLRCSNAACHGALSPADGRSMVDYQSMINPVSNIGFIVQGNPEVSLFYQVMTGTNPHLQNLGLQPTTENQQDGIYRWIKEGALNN
ncbi:MAG: hypothetical protein Kapaf2KO_00740 [Candidatus Kapaibacteriales bacterium]